MALEFARQVFANLQDLIRFIDQKASFTLAGVAGLVALLGIGLASVPEIEGRVPGTFHGIAYGLTLVFGILVAATLFLATRVYRARGNKIAGGKHAPGLIFPLEIEQLLGTGKTYAEALVNISSQDILQSYSRQIEALTRVYSRKQGAINMLVITFAFTVGVWLASFLALALAVVTNGN
jgi:hypothetical protein